MQGDTEEVAEHAEGGLATVTEVAARLADAHGDDVAGLKKLESGLAQFADAPAVERARALLYRAELLVRLGDRAQAQSALAQARALPLDKSERDLIEGDAAHTEAIVSAE
jgi:hypothetical protein